MTGPAPRELAGHTTGRLDDEGHRHRLHAKGADVAFLDLAGAAPARERAWIDQEFVFRDFGLEDVRAVPREQMDAVLFFESVDPPTFIDPRAV